MNSIRLCKIEFLRNLNNIENYIIYLEEQNRLFEKMDMNNAFLKDMNMYEIKKRYVEILNSREGNEENETYNRTCKA